MRSLSACPPSANRGRRHSAGQAAIRSSLARTIGVLGLVGAVIGAGGPGRAGAQEGNPFAARYVEMLRQAGIDPTYEGVDQALGRFQSRSSFEAEFQTLVEQLGDDDFFTRENATRRLLQQPLTDAGMLEAAARSEDLEVRWRAQYVLSATEQPRNELLYALLVVIHDQELTGLAGDVFETLWLCESEHMKLASRRAIEASATRDDRGLLTAQLRHERPLNRSLALGAFAKVFAEEALDELTPMLNDEVDGVRVAAANALVERGSPEAFETLGRLLDSPELSVRNRSIMLLRMKLPQIKQPFSAYASEDTRRRHADAWRAAIAVYVAGLRGESPPQGAAPQETNVSPPDQPPAAGDASPDATQGEAP